MVDTWLDCMLEMFLSVLPKVAPFGLNIANGLRLVFNGLRCTGADGNSSDASYSTMGVRSLDSPSCCRGALADGRFKSRKPDDLAGRNTGKVDRLLPCVGHAVTDDFKPSEPVTAEESGKASFSVGKELASQTSSEVRLEGPVTVTADPTCPLSNDWPSVFE